MKILNQAPMYGVNELGHFQVTFCPATVRETGLINFTGLVWSDCKYKLFKSIQGAFTWCPIVTDQDLISHDNYTEFLDRSTVIILLVNEGPRKFSAEDKTVYGASKKRLEKTKEKLEQHGFNCVHLVKSIKGAERLIRQAHKGTIRRRAENVINVKFGA
jgi:hypothetical protein